MKKYCVPKSISPNHLSGRDVNIIPAMAGAVGFLAGKVAVGAAVAAGGAAAKKMFGDDHHMVIVNSNNLKIR